MKRTTEKIINDFLNEHPKLNFLSQALIDAVCCLTATYGKNKILVCGNGGSAADSEHIAGEFLKSFVLKRPIDKILYDSICENNPEKGKFIADNLQAGIKCIPLTSFCAFNSAFLNDCPAELAFAQLVNVLGNTGDVLIAISTSGNAKNVCYAASVAKAKGIKIIALTGYKGGKLKDYADIHLNVPSDVTYVIQEMHLPVYHALCLAVENEIFGE